MGAECLQDRRKSWIGQIQIAFDNLCAATIKPRSGCLRSLHIVFRMPNLALLDSTKPNIQDLGSSYGYRACCRRYQLLSRQAIDQLKQSLIVFPDELHNQVGNHRELVYK